MASGLELAGLIGTIDATINITSRISAFISDFRHADDDADNLCAKLRLHKIALGQLNAGIQKHFEETLPNSEERDFLVDLQPRLKSLNESLQDQLLRMMRPKKPLISKAAWAASRKANMVSVASEVASWTNALHLIASAIQFNKPPNSPGSSDSHVQLTRLLNLFRHGDSIQQSESAERSMEWKKEDIEIVQEQEAVGNRRRHLVEVCDDQFLASARLHQTTDAVVEWVRWAGINKCGVFSEWIVSEGKRLQTISSCLSWVDPQQTMLLKCLGYFRDEENQRFGLIYQIPENMSLFRGQEDQPLITTLESLLVDKTFPVCSLDQRVGFARDIATAVLYIHAIGWVHKDICPRNIIILKDTRSSQPSQPVPYLVGSRSSRRVFWYSDKRSTESWYYNIYRHPSRHRSDSNARYVMGFDAYSLGVILMELALYSLPEYRPFVTMKDTFQGKSGNELRAELMKLLDGFAPVSNNTSQGVQAIMGRKYHEVVMYCLDRRDTEKEESIAFVKNVWIKLNDLELALF
ncbi:hypothetical protein F4782DRAFT_514270 [Xylaria castorea]|nr:hypothetical protein F4782DRAFT_514270 [Xylaria castorea]